jgi:hypothetical protein
MDIEIDVAIEEGADEGGGQWLGIRRGPDSAEGTAEASPSSIQTAHDGSIHPRGRLMEVRPGYRAPNQTTVLDVKGERRRGIIEPEGTEACRWTPVGRHFLSTGECREENGLCLNGAHWPDTGEKD